MKRRNWLRFYTLDDIKSKYPDLIFSRWHENTAIVKNKIRDRDSGIISIVIVLVLFILLSSLSHFVSDKIITDSFEELIDQRISDIGSIVGITLVVVGWLIASIALKESIAYSMLFKYSYLYSIIYFSLTTIGSLILISTFRELITPKLYKCLILSSTCLIIFILIFIALLFKKIIDFTDDKKIHSLLEKELLREGREDITRNLIKKHSNKIFTSYMEDRKIHELSWADLITNLDFKRITYTTKEEIIETKYWVIQDININELLLFVANKGLGNQMGYTQSFSLNMVTDDIDNYILQKGNATSKADKMKLKKFLIYKPYTNTEDKRVIQNYFAEKLNELVDENKSVRLEWLLNSYFELYKLQIKYS